MRIHRMLPRAIIMAEIEVNNIVKRFGRVTALYKVSMKAGKGINMVLGPNGAGKSTLLRCIAGLYKPDEGSISVLGRNPYYDDAVRKGVSLISDNYGLYDYLGVLDNLKFFGRLYGLSDSEISSLLVLPVILLPFAAITGFADINVSFFEYLILALVLIDIAVIALSIRSFRKEAIL